MTTTEITPELLRDVADLIDGTGHGLGPGAALRDEADRIERRQSDEKRIDELARVWVQVYDNHQGPFDDRVRDGIRAVLAHLQQEHETPKFDQCGIEIKPLRQWSDLRYVPDEVKVVRDPKGIEWHRTPGGGWARDASTWTPGRESSPFTEVIDHG